MSLVGRLCRPADPERCDLVEVLFVGETEDSLIGIVVSNPSPDSEVYAFGRVSDRWVPHEDWWEVLL